MISPVDILAIGIHPDDIELSAAGTLLHHQAMGYTFGLCDLSQGEMGTRGNAELRMIEATNAANILGATFRTNLYMADCFFLINEENIRKIANVIRASRPKIVLANAVADRHPDHGRASKLISDACFYAGLAKMEIKDDEGKTLAPWRPNAVYHYIQDRNLKPDLLVDISAHMDKKLESILAYSSQFYDANSKEPETPISGEGFLDFIKAKNMTFARDINVKFAEGFTVERTIGVKDLFDLH